MGYHRLALTRPEAKDINVRVPIYRFRRFQITTILLIRRLTGNVSWSLGRRPSSLVVLERSLSFRGRFAARDSPALELHLI